jgi:threonine/homoserine/homoserine lactone efflux protein
MADEADSGSAEAQPRPSPAASSFITTEHFTLQGARAATISESTGRASMFLSAVSGGLVALGLIATATRVGTAFYAFGLALLPTLTFIGLVTFERVLQSGIEDHDYARRVSRLRAFYFDAAPEIARYMPTVTLQDRLSARGLSGARRQGYRTVAGMVAVITAVLAGATIGLLVAVVTSHSLAAALVAGGVLALLSLLGLMEYQRRAWIQSEADSRE